MVRRTDGATLPLSADARAPEPAAGELIALHVVGPLVGRELAWCRFDTRNARRGSASARGMQVWVDGHLDAVAMPRIDTTGALALLVDEPEAGREVVVTSPDFGVVAVRFEGKRCSAARQLAEPVVVALSVPGAAAIEDPRTLRRGSVDADGTASLAAPDWPVLALVTYPDGREERLLIAGPDAAARPATDAELTALAAPLWDAAADQQVALDLAADAAVEAGAMDEAEVDALLDRTRTPIQSPTTAE